MAASIPEKSSVNEETQMQDVEKQSDISTEPTTALDPNLIGWDEPEDKDPANPQNWSSGKKWLNVGILSFITFLTPLASSMFAPGVPIVLEEFGSTSSTDATFVVSIFVLGFGIGPLIFGPLSEIYGRLPVYHICNLFFILFTVLCGVAQNMDTLLAVRFFAGCFGVAVITCGGGSIADMMPPQERGGAMAIWSVGPILGPVIGPVTGGFLIDALGWRWVFWLLTILSGTITVIAFVGLSETYAPVLLARKAARLRKETGNTELQSNLATDQSKKAVFATAIVRPMKLLVCCPIVTLMAVYISIAYGLLYILFTTFTFVFDDVYNFGPSTAGLSFLGAGIGSLAGMFYVGVLSDRHLKKIIASGRKPTPEDRLPLFLTVPGSLSLPAGLFIYGWSTNYAVHWIVPEIGTAVTGYGMMVLVMCIQVYLVDAFSIHAASVIAANAVLRSVLGALLPLCALDMYEKLGLGWGNSLLAFIAVALAPVPWIFGWWGERLRTNPKYQLNL
ncbi:MFS general substrate transporter [Pseudovirgaria hyperparasitica]|uniref:MFS general substrate transporter n=1 Tax=Pseudovirgaria hyperparasitica TaxID=470096 RepID=A0A6A6WG62_9PEZI|nr:MFS general substrate transporter [Pseudovirgaria hyperparasitica]KAF2761030.1 MFS general substrate transporter [Pseudovirgaria hyperparasitica]